MMKTAICTPFIDGADRVLGVLQLANKKGGFGEKDEETLDVSKFPGFPV